MPEATSAPKAVLVLFLGNAAIKEPFPEVQVLYNVLRPSFTNVH